MKIFNIYRQNVYIVLEVDKDIFNNIPIKLIESYDREVKYLLGNEDEYDYVCTLIKDHKCTDYYKFVLKE